MTRKPTQKERVLNALRSYRGVCQAEFLAPDVCDNLTPITRLAARVQDLRDEGHVIAVIGTRSKCKIYRWVSGPELDKTARPTEPQGEPTPPLCPGPAGGDSRLAAAQTVEQDTLFGRPRVKGRHGWSDQEQAA